MTINEFDLIEKYFQPLCSEGAPAFGLKNDAAVFSPPSGYDLVFTKDTLVSGIHFFDNDNPGLVAQKALRVNLSDLAAMGAEPKGYLLSIALPKNINLEEWLASFTSGLKKDQLNFGFELWGGDTVTTDGPVTISVTAIGITENGKYLSRSGAKVGDEIYVSGTLGDAAGGLFILKNKLDKSRYKQLVDRYHLPEPRIDLGKVLVNGLATAAMDISDGLMGDLYHICKNSSVGAKIFYEKIPLSPALGNLLETKEAYNRPLWNGGDDYELLFTIPKENIPSVLKQIKDTEITITKIGEITEDQKAILIDHNNSEIELEEIGYRHFK